jgi:hypothetical protein
MKKPQLYDLASLTETFGWHADKYDDEPNKYVDEDGYSFNISRALETICKELEKLGEILRGGP